MNSSGNTNNGNMVTRLLLFLDLNIKVRTATIGRVQITPANTTLATNNKAVTAECGFAVATLNGMYINSTQISGYGWSFWQLSLFLMVRQTFDLILSYR